MTWQIMLSLGVTVPAVIITILTIPFLLLRRYRIRMEHERRAKERGVPHIESPYCKCYYCEIYPPGSGL